MTSSATKLTPRSPLGWLPRLSVMDRYIGSELVLPFLFGVGVFSSLGVSVGEMFYLIRKITESDLAIGTAIEVLALQLPQFIAYSFPMATLLAALMTYSRLSSDSELIAMKGCGVSLFRMVVPALLLSLVVTGMTFAFNELIVPSANYRASVTLDRALDREKPAFREKNILYQEFQTVETERGNEERVLSRLFYAQEFDGQKMQGLTILDFSQQGLSQIISSRSATWNNTDSTWDFANGTIYAISSDGSFRNILRFDQQQLKLPRTPLDFASEDRQPDEMNIVETQQYAELVRQTGDEDKVRQLEVEIQRKLALPFACLAFGFVGAVLGTKPQRSGRATSFGVSIVMIFTYYLLASIAGAIAETGAIPAFLGGWAPNLFGFAVGLVLLLRFSR